MKAADENIPLNLEFTMEIQSASSQPDAVFQNMLKGVNNDMQICIQNCLQCHQACEQIIAYCLQRGSIFAAPSNIQGFRDCADVCELAANFMMRGSRFHTRSCDLCAELCAASAEICERMSDDEMMKTCADICRRCADSCREMGSFEH